MPKVKVKATTSHNPEETFEKISNLLESDGDLRKLDPKYSCHFDRAGLSGLASGSQFKAHMKISEQGDGANVEIVVDLPLHLTLVKGFVQKTLQKKLQDTLQNTFI